MLLARSLLFLLLATALPGVLLQAQSREEMLQELREPLPNASDAHALTVLDYYRQRITRGQPWDSLQSLRLKGTRVEGREEMLFELVGDTQGRLFLKLGEQRRFDVREVVTVFDGAQGWRMDLSEASPRARTEDVSRPANFLEENGLLMPLDWVGQFQAYTYLGPVTHSPTPQVMLKAHRADGRTVELVFDARSYLLLMARWREIYRGAIVQRAMYFSEYKLIEDFWLPVQVETTITRRPFGTYTFEDIRPNTTLMNRIFDMPEGREPIVLRGRNAGRTPETAESAESAASTETANAEQATETETP